MEGLVISEGDNLTSVLVENEGKQAVISKGLCPVCSQVITFEQIIDRKDWTEALCGSLYELFLQNHEVCLSCRNLFEKWIKEHKELADRKHITYRDVGNKYLEKLGKEPIIGTIIEETEDNDEETEEVSPSILDNNERRLLT